MISTQSIRRNSTEKKRYSNANKNAGWNVVSVLMIDHLAAQRITTEKNNKNKTGKDVSIKPGKDGGVKPGKNGGVKRTLSL